MLALFFYLGNICWRKHYFIPQSGLGELREIERGVDGGDERVRGHPGQDLGLPVPHPGAHPAAGGLQGTVGTVTPAITSSATPPVRYGTVPVPYLFQALDLLGSLILP